MQKMTSSRNPGSHALDAELDQLLVELNASEARNGAAVITQPVPLDQARRVAPASNDETTPATQPLRLVTTDAIENCAARPSSREAAESVDRASASSITNGRSSSGEPAAATPPAPLVESNEGLLELLGELCNRRDASGQPANFAAFANDFLRVSMALNELGIVPPRFRPNRRAPPTDRNKDYGKTNRQLSCYQQLVDLHWLFCTGKRDRIPEAGIERLFEGPEFDWDAARQLAEKPWKSETKAIRSLRLSDFEQWQLYKLQTPKLRQRWDRIRIEAPAVEVVLKNRARRFPSLAAELQDLLCLWQADKLCGDSLLKDKAHVHMWLTGRFEPWSPQKTRDRLRKLRGHLEADKRSQ